ncbi:hypothetical protein C8R43DRAFT_953071 [Mycena crocata]|nr:hypothetical protein C8R43DRAFT_953071 [Mycena crocata]
MSQPKPELKVEGTDVDTAVEDSKDDWTSNWDAMFDNLLQEYQKQSTAPTDPPDPSPWNDPTWDFGHTDGEWTAQRGMTPVINIDRSFMEGGALEQQWDYVTAMLWDVHSMPPGQRFLTPDEYAALLTPDKSISDDSSDQIDHFRRAPLHARSKIAAGNQVMEPGFPDHSARLEYIELLQKIKSLVEKRQIEAKAQVEAIRDRYGLDDDLAFEADMLITPDAILWEEEVNVLAEEHRRILLMLDYCEKHTTYHLLQITSMMLQPQPEQRRTDKASEVLPRVGTDCQAHKRMQAADVVNTGQKRRREEGNDDHASDRAVRQHIDPGPEGMEIELAPSEPVEGPVEESAESRAERRRVEEYTKRRRLRRTAKQEAVAEITLARLTNMQGILIVLYSDFAHTMLRQARYLPKKMSDTEDRAFKLRAMHTVGDGRRPDPLLQQWLDRYIPPPTIQRPLGYVAGGLVMERVRARAEERAKRRAHIIELRLRPHRGPPLILTRVPAPPSPMKPGPTLQQRLAAYEAAKENKIKLAHIYGLRERGMLKRAAQRKMVRENAAQRARERQEREARRMRSKRT